MKESTLKKELINIMVTNIVYILIGLILCFVLYIAFRAINTGMEAKKANKNLDITKEDNPNIQEDLISRLNELNELHEKKVLNDEEFAAAKKKVLDE